MHGTASLISTNQISRIPKQSGVSYQNGLLSFRDAILLCSSSFYHAPVLANLANR